MIRALFEVTVEIDAITRAYVTNSKENAEQFERQLDNATIGAVTREFVTPKSGQYILRTVYLDLDVARRCEQYIKFVIYQHHMLAAVAAA